MRRRSLLPASCVDATPAWVTFAMIRAGSALSCHACLMPRINDCRDPKSNPEDQLDRPRQMHCCIVVCSDLEVRAGAKTGSHYVVKWKCLGVQMHFAPCRKGPHILTHLSCTF